MGVSQYVKLLHQEEDLLPNVSLRATTIESSGQLYSKRRELSWVLNFIVLSASVSLLLYAWNLTAGLTVDTLKHARAKHQQWKAVIGDVPEVYQRTRFDGEFIVSDAYRGPPSAKVDAAWKRLIPLKALQVDEKTFSTMNASRYSVQLPEDLGQGYLVYLESVHYIHCVFALWQSTYPDYYKDEWQYGIDHPDSWHTHLDHCADILRQKLMCDADVGLLGFNWLKNHYAPHINFNSQHQCRDYQIVLDWARRHQADEGDKYGPHIVRPEDQPTVNYEVPPYDPFLKGDAAFRTDQQEKP